MRPRAITAIALAGLAPAALAQSVTLHIHADRGNNAVYEFSETITWTVSVTGLTANQFFQAYDLDFDASSNVGIASGFVDNLSALTNPQPGTPNGSSLLGVQGAQSTTLDPLNAVFGDLVLGTFTVFTDSLGILSYSVSDGGVVSAPFVRIRTGSDFGPIVFEGEPSVVSDRVFIFEPTPGTATALALAGFVLARRRRLST